MPRHDPKAVANEFLRREDGPVNQMRLQKLVYIAHGWNLAVNGEPLTNVDPSAWDNGPVYRTIWDHIRQLGYNASNRLLGSARDDPYEADLTEREQDVIDHVWNRYSSYTGGDLSKMTHEEGTPWSNAYFGRGRNEMLNRADIQRHFTELALAGRN